MKTFQYKILRYLPDRVRGEFINVGIVVFDRITGEIAGRFNQDINRQSLLYPFSNGTDYCISVFNCLQQQFDNLKASSPESITKKYLNLDAITNSILPKDDSVLYFTETNLTLDTTIDSATEDLYNRIVHHSIIK